MPHLCSVYTNARSSSFKKAFTFITGRATIYRYVCDFRELQSPFIGKEQIMMRSRSLLFVFAGLLFSHSLIASSVASAQTSSAEELTKVLPDDVLGFVATSGGDSLKVGFEKSILGRIWNDQSVQAFSKSLKQELVPKLKQEIDDPDAAGMIDGVLGYVKLALSRPIVVGAARRQGGEGPPVFGFAILNAGPRKAEIAAALNRLESLADEGDIVDVTVGSLKMHAPEDADDVPLYWGWVGNYLVVAVNDSEGLAVKYVSAPRAETAQYFAAVPGTDDALAVHYDLPAIIDIATAVARSEGSGEEVALIRGVLKDLGLDNIKRISARVGFAGPDVLSNSLIEVPEPRTGLFAHLKPIDVSMFDMVDAGAMNATAVNLDLGGIYDTVLGAIKKAAGEDFAEVEQGIAAVESQLKFKVRLGLLESLSGEMVFYSLPSGVSTQSPMGGFVFVVGLKDARLWNQTMGALGEFAAAASDGMVQVSSQEQGGRTLHTWAIVPLAMAQIMPTWTVVGERAVVASNPAICNGAVEQITSGAKSIRSTEGFRTATAELPSNLISLKYTDSELQFTQLMTVLQQFWPMATMFATKAELKLPVVLPNLSHIAKEMGPACQYSWFDDHGLRSRYRGPGVEPSLGGVAGAAVGMGVMMPALSRARNQSRNITSMSHLKQIGLALIMYADEHDGKFPDSVEQAHQYYRDSEILDSPQKPAGFDGPSYIYVKGHSLEANSPSKMVLAYENPEYLRESIPVLFLDGHVEKMPRDRFVEALEATYKQLENEMPEIKFGR
jgi:prepilin-type processing-associated H-X9-DG protein